MTTLPIEPEHPPDAIDTKLLSGQPATEPQTLFSKEGGVAGMELRHTFLHHQGNKIPWLSKSSYPPDTVEGNIENYIGTVPIPVGLAGPLNIRGDHANGNYHVPMATTEGSLVASYSRGMSMIRRNGGCIAKVFDEGMQRAPLFRFKSLNAAFEFTDWIHSVKKELQAVAERTTSHGQLTDIDLFSLGRIVVLRLGLHTRDAAGQNMVNLASYEICRFIRQTYPGWDEVETFHLASGFCSDKKYSQINILKSRGKKVTAEALISMKTIESMMRTTPEQIVSLYLDGTLTNIYAGCTGNGLHASNGIAAIFTACGQDIATIAESHSGFLDIKLDGNDLYAAVTLPSLIIGTVGGGTGLPAQRECLDLMGCCGKGKANKLAEITAGSVLAGELSLIGAITSMEWVMAHESLGRNRPG